MLNSIAPKWLFEDYPKLQNSSVIKSLQVISKAECVFVHSGREEIHGLNRNDYMICLRTVCDALLLSPWLNGLIVLLNLKKKTDLAE